MIDETISLHVSRRLGGRRRVADTERPPDNYYYTYRRGLRCPDAVNRGPSTYGPRVLSVVCSYWPDAGRSGRVPG